MSLADLRSNRYSPILSKAQSARLKYMGLEECKANPQEAEDVLVNTLINWPFTTTQLRCTEFLSRNPRFQMRIDPGWRLVSSSTSSTCFDDNDAAQSTRFCFISRHSLDDLTPGLCRDSITYRTTRCDDVQETKKAICLQFFTWRSCPFASKRWACRRDRQHWFNIVARYNSVARVFGKLCRTYSSNSGGFRPIPNNAYNVRSFQSRFIIDIADLTTDLESSLKNLEGLVYYLWPVTVLSIRIYLMQPNNLIFISIITGCGDGILMTIIHWRMWGKVRVLQVIGNSSNLQQRVVFLKNLEWTTSNLRKEIFSLCLGSVGGTRPIPQIKLWTRRLVLY